MAVRQFLAYARLRLALAGAGWAACAVAGAAPLAAPPDLFSQQAASYLLMSDGRLLAARAPDRALPIASLTKIMTALLAAESDVDPERPVRISAAAAHETGTRLGLQGGERLRFDDLLAATLIDSSNDACHALADAVAGSQARFVARMNARAHALQLNHTHFANACGHDAPANRSTARELAALTLVALQQPRIRALVALPHAELHTLDEPPRRLALDNKNALIGRYPGAVGVKSGTTPAAGKCLVAVAQRRSHWVLLVLLHAAERWWTAVAMLDTAFAAAGVAP
jgi:D-alanyl-D-alanine carboxypeptidase (penicillin-binding protein 5/6)